MKKMTFENVKPSTHIPMPAAKPPKREVDTGITIKTCPSDDWVVLQSDLGEGYFTAGHQITTYEWIELLETLGYEVERLEISDRDMENGNY